MKLTNLIQVNKKNNNVCRLLIIAVFTSFSVFTYAQHQQVNLKGDKVTLKSAFKQIEQQTQLFVD